MGLILFSIPCWFITMLAILLIWGGTALGIALIASVFVLITVLMWVGMEHIPRHYGK